MRMVLMACVGAVVLTSGAAGRDDPPEPAAPRDREIAALRKENELLRKEVELLKKELELLKAQGGAAKPGDPGGPAKTTLDDVEYEFVSIKMNGNAGVMRLAITSKRPGKVLDTQGIRLIAADGTEHRAPLVGVLRNSGPQNATLPVGVRTVLEFHIGEVPAEVKAFATIQLPGVINSGAKRLKNPVVLKGTFKVER